jgi:hypothetical protein
MHRAKSTDILYEYRSRYSKQLHSGYSGLLPSLLLPLESTTQPSIRPDSPPQHPLHLRRFSYSSMQFLFFGRNFLHSLLPVPATSDFRVLAAIGLKRGHAWLALGFARTKATEALETMGIGLGRSEA